MFFIEVVNMIRNFKVFENYLNQCSIKNEVKKMVLFSEIDSVTNYGYFPEDVQSPHIKSSTFQITDFQNKMLDHFISSISKHKKKF